MSPKNGTTAMNITISPEARANIYSIVQNNDSRAFEEVAETYVLLEHLGHKISGTSNAYWESFKNSDPRIRLISTLKGNIPIWQLHPAYVHCVTVLVEVNGGLRVLSFCSRVELDSTLIHLIDTFSLAAE
jgi:hypothetical protein